MVSILRFASIPVLLIACLAASLEAAVEPRLTVGEPLALEITEAESVPIALTTPAGKLVTVTAQQIEANVALELYRGEDLVDRVASSGVPGTERLEWIAADDLRLAVDPAEGAKGKVVLTLDVSDPTEQDRQRVRGAQLVRRADRLMEEQSAGLQAEALQLYDEGVAILREAGDAASLGHALDSWAWALSMAGQKPRALPLALEALEFRRSARDAMGEISTLQMIGLIHLWLGDWENALEVNRSVTELARARGDRGGEAASLHNLGGIHWSIDEMERALDVYSEAMKIHEELGNQLPMATTLNNMGDTYRRLGDYDQALEYFDRALEIRRARSDKGAEAHSLHTIALTWLEKGEPERAREIFRQALAIRTEVGDRRGIAYSTGGLGSALHALGEHEAALVQKQQALSMWQELGEKRGRLETLSDLGRVLNALGRREEALTSLNEAVSTAQNLRDHTTEAESWLSIAMVHRDSGRYADAVSAVEKAIEVIDRLRAGIGSKDLRTTYFARVRRFYDFYVDLLMRMDEADSASGSAWKALEVAERARARTLLETLAAARVDIRTGVDPQLIHQEAELVRRIRLGEKTRAVLLESADRAQLEALEQELARLAREHDALVGRIRRSSPAYAALALPQPLAASAIRGLLDESTMLIEAHVGEDVGYVWFATADSLTWRRIPGRREVDAASRELHRLLTARAGAGSNDLARIEAELSASASRLAEWIAPANRAEGIARVLYVPDAGLNYVPLAALPAGGTPMVATYEITTAPSVSVVGTMRTRDQSRSETSDRIAVFADPVFRSDDPRVRQSIARMENRAPAAAAPEDAIVLRSAADAGIASLPRLRFSRREAQAIANLAGGDAVSALDFDADRERLLQSDLSEYGTIHFATHGIINSRAPELSGLVLSLVGRDGSVRDGFVSLGQIYNMELSANLVVLSACQTALGDEVRGEGLVGLTRGFMHAGADRVVASLWQVDDRATSVLMERFYRALLEEGTGPAEALRRAQLSMLQEERWSSPYFWAAFQVQGDWR